MKRISTVSNVVWMMALALVGAACQGIGEPPAGEARAALCTGLLDACSADSECCPGTICAGNSCHLPEGAACNPVQASDGQCEPGTICVGDVCSSTCGAVGASCLNHTDCCTGVCDTWSSYPGSCACIALLDACSQDSDCCQGACINGSCHLPEGSPCDPEGASDGQCAPGTHCVGDVCTSACGAVGASCLNHTDCCTGVCDTWSSDPGRCACIALLDACSQDSDCCQGACINGSCHLPEGSPCDPEGASDGQCAPGTHCVGDVCTSACGAVGDSCLDLSDCCSGACIYHYNHGACGTGACTTDIDCGDYGECVNGSCAWFF